MTKTKVKIGMLEPGTTFTWERDLGFGGHILKQYGGMTLVQDSGGDGRTYTERRMSGNMEVWTEFEVLPKEVWDWLGEFN